MSVSCQTRTSRSLLAVCSFALEGVRLRFRVFTRPLIHIKEPFAFRILFYVDATVLERTMAQTTIAYLERRYTALECEIADALSRSPTNDLAIADLKYRKRIIADEIQYNRRLVERFSKLSAY